MKPRFSADFWLNRAGLTEVTGVELGLPAGKQQTEPGEWYPPAPGSWSGGGSRPVCLYVPRDYEPNYPYPLIVWFHRAGGNERDVLSVLPEISDRNYLGLSLRGAGGASPSSRACSTAASWTDSERTTGLLENELYRVVRRLRREYHVHSERVFAAGLDQGATTALNLLWRRPEWFAGAIAFGGRLPRFVPARDFCRRLQGKRILVGAGGDGSAVDAVVNRSRLLHTAGAEVTTHIADDELGPQSLRRIDHWLMEGICAAA